MMHVHGKDHRLWTSTSSRDTRLLNHHETGHLPSTRPSVLLAKTRSRAHCFGRIVVSASYPQAICEVKSIDVRDYRAHSPAVALCRLEAGHLFRNWAGTQEQPRILEPDDDRRCIRSRDLRTEPSRVLPGFSQIHVVSQERKTDRPPPSILSW